MTPVGFEPTQLTLVELESTPLDHSGKVSLQLKLEEDVCNGKTLKSYDNAAAHV